ncbi:IS110 family transposase [Candidatus Woesearchaeota archaeon]|nr:IS110 family transposase [Candidatus Woesearchaeota archaeon]
MQQFVGLDVHKAIIYGVVLDEEGNVAFERKFKSDPHELDEFLVNVQPDSKIALESCSCWQYVYDYLHDAGYENVMLANPLGVRLIGESRKKTDKRDAFALADLLRMNRLPEAYAAPFDVRVKRQITRHRLSLVGLQTEVKNKIHAILLRHGINVDDQYSDVFGKAGIEYLRSLDLPYCDRFELDQYLSIIEMLMKRIEMTQQRIEELAGDDPDARVLMSMPGISYYSALMIKAEIGDIRRFPDHERLTSYAGLNPSVYQSSNTCITGHISKQGSKHLRWILVQAANVAVQHDRTLGAFYKRLAKGKGHSKAIVATARKMLKYAHTMMTHNIPYHALQVHKKAT